jgi:hypothetical protein
VADRPARDPDVFASRRLIVALTLACVLGRYPAAFAQDTPDRQAWVQVLAVGQISERWRTHLELQPRVMDGASELGLTIVRHAFGRQLTPRASLWLGHAWVPRTLGPGVKHEQRIWQQFSYAAPAGAWTATVRLRLEQRWLDPWEDNSHRLRMMVRAQRPIGASRWSVAAYDEAMITVDRTPLGPPRGFDRNRLYGGLARRVSRAASVEGGYIWENSVTAGATHRNDHIAIAVVNLAAPSMK